MEEERWVPVKGLEGKYEISNYGRVKSLGRKGNHFKTHFLTLTRNGPHHKYIIAQLWDGNKKQSTMVHRLVALHFLENPINVTVVHHKDGNKENNHVSNLEWCTTRQNLLYDFAMGVRSNRGEKSPMHKLTKREVDFIRYLFGLYPNMNETWIARFYGISQHAISCVVNFKTWKIE
jgi:hypothetical protein